MSRKDFKLIAATIAAMPIQHRASVAYMFALTLPKSNTRFDINKFLRACDVKLHNYSGLRRAKSRIVAAGI